MRKFFKAAVSAILMSLLIFSAAACNGNNGGSSANGNGTQAATAADELVGTWKMQFDASKLPEDQKANEAFYAVFMSSMNMTVEFKSDNTVAIEMSMDQISGLPSQETSSQSGTGKWTREGDKVIISDISGDVSMDPTGAGESSSDGKYEMKLQDGKLIIEGAEMLPFVKQ